MRKEVVAGRKLPRITVRDNEFKARRLYSIAAARMGTVTLVLTDGTREYVVEMPLQLLRTLQGMPTHGVMDLPRPKDVPSRIILSLANRGVVGKKWLAGE